MIRHVIRHVIRRGLLGLSIVVLLSFVNCSAVARADEAKKSPIQYSHEKRTDPAMSVYLVKVDLTNPNVAVRITPAGDDPDGDGPWQTVLMVPSAIAEREKFDVCVNAS